MDKVINFIIVLLIIIISGITGFYIITKLNYPTYTLNIVLNGADSVSDNNITCQAFKEGCKVTLPSIQRNNGVSVGYNLHADDTTALYKEGETIFLENDMELFAITYKNRSIKIDSSDVDFIEKNTLTCQSFNAKSDCSVELPIFNKKGYQIVGYSTNKNNKTGFSDAADKNISVAQVEYFIGMSYLVNDESEKLTLYPKYERVGGTYNTTSYGVIHGNYLEYSSSCSLDKIKSYLDEVYKHLPFLFTGSKINVVDSTQFNNYWGWLGANRVDGILAITYVGDSDNWVEKVEDHLKPSNIDIKCDKGGGVYHTLVHEMVHTWDDYYSMKRGDVGPKIISKNNEGVSFKTMAISAMPDIINIYKKYNDGSCSKKLYCSSKITEFVAEIFSHYYDIFIIKDSWAKESDFPEDLRKVVEKYICIAKNNYQESGC